MGKCNVGTAHFRNSRVTMPRVRTPPLSNAAMTYRRGATFASSHHICIQRCQKKLRCTYSSHLCIKSVTCLLVFYLVLSCLLYCASRTDFGAPAAYIRCKGHHVRRNPHNIMTMFDTSSYTVHVIWDAFRTDKQVICLCCIVCFNFDSLFVSWMRPYLDVNNGGCVCVVVGWRPVCMQT